MLLSFIFLAGDCQYFYRPCLQRMYELLHQITVGIIGLYYNYTEKMVVFAMRVSVWVPHSVLAGPSPAVGTRCFALSQHALGGCEHCRTHTDASASDCRIQALERERERERRSEWETMIPVRYDIDTSVMKYRMCEVCWKMLQYYHNTVLHTVLFS